MSVNSADEIEEVRSASRNGLNSVDVEEIEYGTTVEGSEVWSTGHYDSVLYVPSK